MTRAPTYTGKPCPRGHNGGKGATRYVSNKACVDCAAELQRALYDRTAERNRKRAYRAKARASNQLKVE